MGKRMQTLNRGRLGKSVMDRQIQVWGVRITKKNICEMQKKMKRSWRSAWRHLSSMVEAMWLSRGTLVVVNGTLKKECYHSILQRHAIPWGRSLIGANLLLQQDNDPKHSSKLCNNYLGKKQSAGILSIMEWPAKSPDLNPFELLWEQLDRMVSKMSPSSQSNLWEVLQITSTNWQLECQRSARL